MQARFLGSDVERHNQHHSFLRPKNAKSHRVKPGDIQGALCSPPRVSQETFLLFGRVPYSEVHSSATVGCDNNKHGDLAVGRLAVGPTFWRFVDVCYSVCCCHMSHRRAVAEWLRCMELGQTVGMFPARPAGENKGRPEYCQVLPWGTLHFWREENYDVGCGIRNFSEGNNF